MTVSSILSFLFFFISVVAEPEKILSKLFSFIVDGKTVPQRERFFVMEESKEQLKL